MLKTSHMLACCHVQVNYLASKEYEALVNYKVLQQGFTGIGLTRVGAIQSADVLTSSVSRSAPANGPTANSSVL